MAAKESKNEFDSSSPLPIPRFLGYSLLAAGIGVLWAIPRIGAGDWLWYAGVTVAGVGAVLWFISGMPRDQVGDWLKQGAFALAIALTIRWAIAEPYRIPSGSMQTTLHGDERIGRGDRVFVNKWIYGIRYPFMNKRIYYGQAPQRWDIAVFKTVEEDAVHKTLVKRIVGMPGERISIRNGKVYADGEALDLPPGMPEDMYYTAFSSMEYGVRGEEEYAVVPEGNYLMLGDNSKSSRDGRYFGWLPNEHIVGRVASIWWPPQRWRDFTGFSKTLWWRLLVLCVGVLIFVRIFVGRSWPAHAHPHDGVDHLFISFLKRGLRVPFTCVWLLRWGTAKRGDVILYVAPKGAGLDGAVLLGRVAGMPGERVSITDGRIHINDRHLAQEGRLSEAEYGTTEAKAVYGRSRGKEHAFVPEGHYFIVTHCPEREAPLDSRTLGWIPEAHLLGKATMAWWPPSRWKRTT